MQYAQERQIVVDLCLELSRRSYFSGTGGNIALRVDHAHIAVTPSATDYLSMSASDVCILKLADLSVVEGDRDPSVETSLHARVLRARKDVRCSIHTHQPIASACALLGKELDVPPEFRRSLGCRIPVAGYAPSGSGLLSRLLGRRVRSDVNAYLMLNHGVLCCGSSPEEAMQTVEDLESLARAHLQRRIVARAPLIAPLQKALWRVADALTKRHPE